MDTKSAEELLVAVRSKAASEKTAEFGWDDIFGNSNAKRLGELKELRPRQVAKNRQSQILNALLLAGGAGAALRGGLGLSRMFSEEKPVPSRTVDMPLLYPGDEDEEKAANEKSAEGTVTDRLFDMVGMGPKADPQATEESGVGGYLPALLLGTPLAAYAGWKGVDAIFDKQRKEKTKNHLAKAKRDYEAALLGSYKTASDNSSPIAHLDKAFDSLEKAAEGSLLNPMNWLPPNLSGQAKGLLATYAMLSGPAAYMYVNDKMKKSSKRSVLRSAMKERARRRAIQSPAELYAVPEPRERKKERERDEDII
jgi:hypothetical protein